MKTILPTIAITAALIFAGAYMQRERPILPPKLQPGDVWISRSAHQDNSMVLERVTDFQNDKVTYEVARIALDSVRFFPAHDKSSYGVFTAYGNKLQPDEHKPKNP